MPGRSIRIADVAREANVSPTAVSFAFNSPHRLNPQTVERILEAANRLGYAPNPHARALLAKSIGVIGVLVPQSIPSIFANPFFSAFFEGVGQVCEENNLSLLTVSPVGGSLTKAIANAPVDGLIVVGLNDYHADVEILIKRNIPFVITDGDAHVAPSVNIDDEGGAFQAADFLLHCGHQNVICLTFEVDFNTSHEKVYGVGERRLQGYRRAFAEHGLAWSDDWLVPTPATATAGAETFLSTWKSGRWQDTTAVLAVSDAIAIGILRAARSQNMHVPNDLSIIGFDDIPFAAWTQPALTTVRQPIVEKGEVAAQMLLSLIANDSLLSPCVVLPTELIIRESAGPARK